jgi:hypothetical protein
MLQIQLKEGCMVFPLMEIDPNFFLLKSKATHDELKDTLDKWCEENSASNELQYLTSLHKSRVVPIISCPSLMHIEQKKLKSVTTPFTSVRLVQKYAKFSFPEAKGLTEIGKHQKFDWGQNDPSQKDIGGI